MPFTKIAAAGISSSGSFILQNISSSGVITATSIVATTGTFSGNVSIAGTLTYEDVTNIDSLGIVTARTGINVLAGGINAVGVVTASSGFSGNLTGNVNSTGVSTFATAGVTQLNPTNLNVSGVSTFAGITTVTGTTLFAKQLNVSGVVTATSFVGSGANLTGIAVTANVVTNSFVVSGVATVSAGSTAAPSISPSGDSNTGIFFPSADTVCIGEGGSEVLRIDSSSRVGIGTTNPTSKLQVVGDTRVSGVVTAFDFYNDAEYPSVRPTLDLAFAQTKILDSRITFSRSSTATYVNASGIVTTAATNEARFDHDSATGESLGLLIEESRTNQITYSNTGFSENNVQRFAGVAPDGTFTAALLTNGNASSGNYINPGAGTFTYSIYVKQGTSSTFVLTYAGYGYTDWTFTFATESFVVSSVAGWTNASVQKLSNGWYRLSATHGNRPLYYYGFSTDSATSTVYFWGHQREAGSFPTSYIPTPATFTSRASTATYYDGNGVIQTASSNVARSAAFFPDSNGVMRSAGLLLEAAGTNLVTYSEQFDNAAWTKESGLSVSANTTTSPDGTLTADTATHSSAAGALVQNTAAGAGIYTYSIFLKYVDASWIRLVLGNTTDNANAWFNLSTGAAGSTAINGSISSRSSSIQKLSNGWYRCTLTASLTSLNTNYVQVSSASADLVGTRVVGSFYTWGAQLEASPYATSYIPTTTATVTRAADVSSSATVTRSADVASITGTNFSSWFNSTQGTFFIDEDNKAIKAAVARSAYDVVCNKGLALTTTASGTSNRLMAPVHMTRSNNTIDVSVFLFNGGGTDFGPSIFNVIPFGSVNNLSRAAFYIDPPSQRYAIAGGGQINTLSSNSGRTGDYSYTFADKMIIGYNSGYYGTFNGTISRLTYYPVRLSNSVLQTITL